MGKKPQQEIYGGSKNNATEMIPGNNPTKILFKYPSKGRPERFIGGMDSIYQYASDKTNLHVLVTCADYDETMNNPEMIAKIASYPNTTVIFGENTSKIQVINRDFDKPGVWNDFDILICMSDDMRFNVFGFDDMIRVDMNAHFPNMDGLLHYPDQDAKEHLATMYIAGRYWFERRGRMIYHSSYKSLWCDNEEQDVAKICGKYKYCGYQINVHLNPAYGHLERDALFEKDQSYWNEDEKNYYERKARNFDL